MKSKTRACKKANKLLSEMEEMLMAGHEPTVEQMDEYNKVSEFCERMMDNKKWTGYNREVRGAIYPADLAYKHLTGEQAKNWVSNMYHKTMSGEIVKGEKWDITTTTKVLEDSGVIFDDTMSNIEGYIAMHKAWHDFYKSAYKANMENVADFYVALASDMLIDDDAKHTAKERFYIKHYLMTM